MEKSLKIYNQKRNFSKTAEPVGKKSSSDKKRRFVVQHHAARRDHYDFRLELSGTMKSWAVPKGPSYNTKDKRLAVMVEDHPLEYRNFEGTIPKGEYGGGTVMIWDEGYWEPLDTPKKGLKDGSLKFILHGHRLRGKWTLVHFKEDNWLLIKEKDNIHLFDDIKEFSTSIRTKRTMQEIAENKKAPSTKNSKKENLVEGVKITNPEKIIFKSPKTTKMKIAEYYHKIAKRMMPYLDTRLISTIRCPEGTTGQCFFKKHLETKSVDIAKVDIPNEKGKKEDYYYITDTPGIISEVQMNSYEFHIWGSQADDIDYPNILVFDIDPDEGMNVSRVREAAKDLKSILDKLSLQSFIKTSGGKGYHILVPTKKLKEWPKFREFAKNIAELMEKTWPDKYVSNVRKEKRKGKIFIDWIRNTKGATSVAPYSIRTKKKPTVSMPIRWSELDKVKPDGITMEEAIKRIKRKDPWEGFFELDQ